MTGSLFLGDFCKNWAISAIGVHLLTEMNNNGEKKYAEFSRCIKKLYLVQKICTSCKTVEKFCVFVNNKIKEGQ